MNPAQSALALITQLPALPGKLGDRPYRALLKVAELLGADHQTDWICVQYVATALCRDPETTRRDLVALQAVGLVQWEDNGKSGRGARRRYRLCLGHLKTLLVDGTAAVMRKARDAVRSGSTPCASVRKALRLAALRLRYPFKGRNASAMQGNLTKRETEEPKSSSVRGDFIVPNQRVELIDPESALWDVLARAHPNSDAYRTAQEALQGLSRPHPLGGV